MATKFPQQFQDQTDGWKQSLNSWLYYFITQSASWCFNFITNTFSRGYFLQGSVSYLKEVDEKFQVESVGQCKREFSVVGKKRSSYTSQDSCYCSAPQLNLCSAAYLVNSVLQLDENKSCEQQQLQASHVLLLIVKLPFALMHLQVLC